MKFNALTQYNNKYSNVFYKDKWWHLYNENTTNSLDALYSETQIKWVELIQKCNCKIFYFTCSPKTKDKIFYNSDNNLDVNHPEVISIQNNQCEDLMYFYKNQLFEVIYTFPIINSNNNYHFNFVLIVKNDFNLNNVLKKSFNLININIFKEILISDINFDLISFLFEQRTCLEDYKNFLTKRNYDFSQNNISEKNFFKICTNKFEYDREEHLCINSQYFKHTFNQHLYVLDCFRFLSSQIWSFDRVYYKEYYKNNSMFMYMYNETYNINSLFLTNYAEIMGIAAVSFDENSFNNKISISYPNYTYCSLSENFHDQDIMDGSLSKKIDKYGFLILKDL